MAGFIEQELGIQRPLAWLDTDGAELYKGRRADTFSRAVDFVARRRADLTSIKPRKYPLEQYREALIEASSKKTSGAVKVSFAL